MLHTSLFGAIKLGYYGEAFLVMSNHQSLYDVPVLFHVWGRTCGCTAKSGSKVPISLRSGDEGVLVHRD